MKNVRSGLNQTVEKVDNVYACQLGGVRPHAEVLLKRLSQGLEGRIGPDGGVGVEHRVVVNVGVGDFGIVCTLALEEEVATRGV